MTCVVSSVKSRFSCGDVRRDWRGLSQKHKGMLPNIGPAAPFPPRANHSSSLGKRNFAGRPAAWHTSSLLWTYGSTPLVVPVPGNQTSFNSTNHNISHVIFSHLTAHCCVLSMSAVIHVATKTDRKSQVVDVAQCGPLGDPEAAVITAPEHE
jgi:hypothetical protein